MGGFGRGVNREGYGRGIWVDWLGFGLGCMSMDIGRDFEKIDLCFMREKEMK